MTTLATPEIGKTVVANGISTNYLDAGSGKPVVFVHGSGPGVTAYANWRLTLPVLADRFHCYAPDMAGFGYTERSSQRCRWWETASAVLSHSGWR